MEDRNTDLAVKLETVNARTKSVEHRVDDLESDMKEVKDIQITIVKLANGIENMGNQLMDVKDNIREIKTGQDLLSDKVTTLENKPAVEFKGKYDGVKEKLLWIFISGVAIYMMAQVFPNIFHV